jgi:hypothetical protein
MMNPIAVAMIALGVVLLLFGLFLVVRRRRAAGIAISLLGVVTAAVPFIASFLLAG